MSFADESSLGRAQRAQRPPAHLCCTPIATRSPDSGVQRDASADQPPDAHPIFGRAGASDADLMSAASAAPLFTGTVHFVQLQCTILDSDRGTSSLVTVSDEDMLTAIEYCTLAADVVASVASQYGHCGVYVSPNIIKYSVVLSTVSHWNSDGVIDFVRLHTLSDEIRNSTPSIEPGSCLAFLNPDGVENTWALANDALGYHWSTQSGPYLWVGAYGSGWTVRDDAQRFAAVLSHELAEMVVNPNPGVTPNNSEVCDPCTNDNGCPANYLWYFDNAMEFIKTVRYDQGSPPQAEFEYLFYISAIVKPVFQRNPQAIGCPADPDSACAYPFVISHVLRDQPRIDAAWALRVWKSVHDPDPSPELTSNSRGVLTTIRAIQALTSYLNDPRAAETINLCLRPLMVRASQGLVTDRR